jgi:hypothetical protein
VALFRSRYERLARNLDARLFGLWDSFVDRSPGRFVQAWVGLFWCPRQRLAQPEWGRVDAEDFPLKYAEDFARLAEQLQGEHHEQPTLERIATLAVQTVDPCDYCGVTLREPNGELVTAAASDPVAARVAELQRELGEGPCVDAVWDLATLTVNDLDEETRWPLWAPAAANLGIRSVLSLGLDISDTPVAASLNLFASRPYAFDSTDLGIASVFARHAATALAAARTEEGLRAAARSRQIIGVAQGMLMQRFGLNLDQSFELLRRYSQTNNLKLRVLAERLAESGGIPDTAPGEPAADLAQAFGITPGDPNPTTDMPTK